MTQKKTLQTQRKTPQIISPQSVDGSFDSDIKRPTFTCIATSYNTISNPDNEQLVLIVLQCLN